MTDNGAVADADAGGISEVLNGDGDRGEGGVITPMLFSSVMLYNCKYNNAKDDGRNVYGNNKKDYIPDDDYRVKDGSIAGMVAGEGKYPGHYEVLEVWILEDGKYSTHYDGD